MSLVLYIDVRGRVVLTCDIVSYQFYLSCSIILCMFYEPSYGRHLSSIDPCRYIQHMMPLGIPEVSIQ